MANGLLDAYGNPIKSTEPAPNSTPATPAKPPRAVRRRKVKKVAKEEAKEPTKVGYGNMMAHPLVVDGQNTGVEITLSDPTPHNAVLPTITLSDPGQLIAMANVLAGVAQNIATNLANKPHILVPDSVPIPTDILQNTMDRSKN